MTDAADDEHRRKARRLKLSFVGGHYYIVGKTLRTGPFKTASEALLFHRAHKDRTRPVRRSRP